MKKTLSYLSFLFVFLLFLNACRTNEIVENEITQNEKIGAFVRFEEKMKTSKNASQNYNQPFAEVIGNYLTNHSSYRNNFEATIGKIDLSMSSQSFGDDYKVVLFPIRNTSNIITDILVARVNQERDFVQFRLLLDDDFKSNAIIAFKNKKEKKTDNKTQDFTYGTTDIETVEIPAPPKKDIWPNFDFFDSHGGSAPSQMDGGSSIHGGGGGASNSTQNNQNTPCDKAKNASISASNLTKNQVFANATTGINATNSSVENGIVFGIVNGQLTSTSVQTSNSAYTVSLSHSFSQPVADAHNHTENKPPSSGDVYNLISSYNTFNSFQTRYVLLKNGTIYALVVTDPIAMNTFLQNNPPNQAQPGLSPNFPGQMFEDYDNFTFEGYGSQEMALAYVLDKYNTGIALTKMNSEGNFKKMGVSITVSNGQTNYTLSNCP